MAANTAHTAIASWQNFCAALSDAGTEILETEIRARTPEQHIEVETLLLRMLIFGSLAISELDADHPDWLPIMNSTMRSPNPNPDTVYHFCSIRGEGRYRIRGDRGSSLLMHMQIFRRCPGFHDSADTLSDTNLDDLPRGEDGGIDILLSESRPDEYEGAWLPLDETVDILYLVVRQVSYDWSAETGARLAIERLDAPIRKGRTNASDFYQRLQEIPLYVRRMGQMVGRMLAAQSAVKQHPNQMLDVSRKFSDVPIIATQAYSQGEFVLKDSEAAILEFTAPRDCPYWNLQLMDSFYNALNYSYAQTGISGGDARVDHDGKVRVVISRRDVGAPNWLDKMDYDEVSLRGRWFACETPDTTTTIVPVDDVFDHLPEGTPVISDEARSTALRRRSQGAQLRRRW